MYVHASVLLFTTSMVKCMKQQNTGLVQTCIMYDPVFVRIEYDGRWLGVYVCVRARACVLVCV